MNKTILILCFLNFYVCYSQNLELPVIDVKISECDNNADTYRIQDRIVTQHLTNDTFTITLGLVENWMGIRDVKSFINEDSLKFYYETGSVRVDTTSKGEIKEYVVIITGECYFEFTFTIKGLKKIPKIITLNGNVIGKYFDKYKIYPIEYDIVNCDTVNYKDKYGLKQGKWTIPEYEVGRQDSVYFVGFYDDNYLKSCTLQYFKDKEHLIHELKKTDFNLTIDKSYFENGELKGQGIENDTSSLITYLYYPNKRLAEVSVDNREFHEEIVFYENGSVKKISNFYLYKEFYENGNLKLEWFNENRPDFISKKIYYDNGNIMAIYFSKYWDKQVRMVEKKRNVQGKSVKTFSNRIIRESKDWSKYFDISGKRVSKENLEKKGYKDLFE
jgi:hypothetical protein